MHALLRAVRVLVIVGIATLESVGAAHASALPSSALSQCTGIDPSLLEQVNLLYRFPQMALADSQASAGPHFSGLPVQSGLFVTTPNYDNAGLGVLVRGASLAAFALSQPSYVEASSNRFEIDRSTQVVQAGVALRAGAVRFGAALRGARVRRSEGNEDPNLTYVRRDFREGDLDYIEGGLGCGMDLGRTRIELEGEIPNRTSESGGLSVSSSDTVGARLQTEPHGAWNIFGRVSRPLGNRAQLIASAGYEHGELEWVGQIYGANAGRDTSLTQDLEGWTGAVSVAMRTAHLDVVAVSAQFSRRFSPGGSFDSNGFNRADHDIQDGSLALSIARQVWRNVVFLAHVQTRYSRSKFETTYGRLSNYSPRIERSSNDNLTQIFGWGATFAYKRFVFVGSLNSPPDLTSPVGVLDLQLAF